MTTCVDMLGVATAYALWGRCCILNEENKNLYGNFRETVFGRG